VFITLRGYSLIVEERCGLVGVLGDPKSYEERLFTKMPGKIFGLALSRSFGNGDTGTEAEGASHTSVRSRIDGGESCYESDSRVISQPHFCSGRRFLRFR